MFGSFQFINTSCLWMMLLLNCMVSLSAWKAPLNKMCFYSSYYSHGDRGVLCFHCKKWTLIFFQPYKWTLSTKRGTRPPVGPEMQISEDSNAIKKMYASHLKLIACFRLGASFFSVSIGWLKSGRRWNNAGEKEKSNNLYNNGGGREHVWKVQYCGMQRWLTRKS